MIPAADDQLARLRRLCLAFPKAWEKVSHGEPTFFSGKRVFAMFANNHHHDGHIAAWIPAPPGHQDHLAALHPRIYFRPPYVGVRGWIGVELSEIDDDALGEHLTEAWKIVTPAKANKSGNKSRRFFFSLSLNRLIAIGALPANAPNRQYAHDSTTNPPRRRAPRP